MTLHPYLPGATFVDLGPDGGSYDETAHPKGCIHTTEGSSLSGAEAAYRNYPPHIGYDPNTRVIHQYVRLDRCSYAFKGAESDDEFIIQVEIIGFAAQTHTYSEQWYRNIGEDIIRPLREIVGIPNNYLTFYGEGDGIVLASPSSPIRLTDSAFRNYSGWLGHQHVPAPDAHWDPGRFNMGLAMTYSESDMTPEEHNMLVGLNNAIGYTFAAKQRLHGEVTLTTEQKLDALTAKVDTNSSAAAAELDGINKKLDQVSTGNVDYQTLAVAVADELDRRARDNDSATGPIS